jgi:hypothetical protein
MQNHSLIRNSFNPFGPLREPHAEQVTVEYASARRPHRLPRTIRRGRLARAIAFVFEHCSERCPAGIEHGFSHVRFCQTGCVHVADEDCTDLHMDRLDAGFFVGPLRRCQFHFRAAIQALRFDFGAIRHRGKVFQSKVDADRGGAGRWCSVNFDADIGVPTTACILAETAGTDVVLAQAKRIPQAEVLAGIPELSVFVRDAIMAKRDPAQ